MGAPKKPMALRQLHGTAHRNKQRNSPSPVKITRGIGPAPKHFSEQQSDTWDYLVNVMFAGVLAESDRPTFEVLSVLFHRFRYGAYGDDAILPALAVGELARMDSIMARYGMTQSDRTKIVVPKSEDKNPFESI